MNQQAWERAKTDRLPAGIAAEVLRQARELHGEVGPDSTSPYFLQNQFLSQQHRAFAQAHIWSAYDEGMVRDCAESWSHACGQFPQLIQREEFARYHGIEPPARRSLTDRYEACAARLADATWWRRQLRKAWTRASENAVRKLGCIRRGKMPYASNEAIGFRRQMKRNARAYIENTVLVNELNEQLPLMDAVEASIANPSLRRGEMMTRVRGFEELARARKDVALFFTLTTPSRFHVQRAAGGKNPAFYVASDTRPENGTVRSAQGWLCRAWARARAALHRRGIVIYGFRVAEPHHDGTPHWHGLFFMRANAADVVSDVISTAWLKESPDEPGARAHRVRIEKIDPARGSAAGYIAKYVAKSIDGAGAIGMADDDETGTPVSESIERIDAWASIHGIRQFQQIGGPTVGLWRELRRLTEPVEDDNVERIRRAADRGDWRAYCRAHSYDPLSRKDPYVSLWKEETGEKSRYGDRRGARVLGVCVGKRVYNPNSAMVTRPHRWKLCEKGRSQQIGTNGSTSGSAHPPEAIGSGSSPKVLRPWRFSVPALGPVAITVRGRRWKLIHGGKGAIACTAPPWVVLIEDEKKRRADERFREKLIKWAFAA
jgi:hypothetical protein